MLPLPYTQNKALGTLAGFLNTIEKKLQPVLRKRVVTRRAGQVLDTPIEQEYLVRPKALSDGAQATGRLLLIMQLRVVEEARRVSFLQEPATDAAPTPPPVTTNSEELARLRKVSSRAIRDHLNELQQVGIVVQRNCRGWFHNFELWISTKFLWKTDAQVVSAEQSKSRTKAAPAALASPDATNFPPIEVLEKQVKKDSDSSGVEKLVTGLGQLALTGNTGLQHPPAAAPTAPKPPRQTKQATKDRGQTGGAQMPSDARKALLLEKHRDMAREFFITAWRVLYPGQSFDEREQNLWKKAVWNGVYHGFAANLSEKQWADFHQVALRRIGMVAKYLLKHPQRFLPKPFAEFVVGSGYFDAENPNGFAATQGWYERKQAQNLQQSLSRDLSTAKKRLNAHRLGLSTKRDQARTRLQLYRLLETGLRRKHGAEGLALFHAAVAAPRQ